MTVVFFKIIQPVVFGSPKEVFSMYTCLIMFHHFPGEQKLNKLGTSQTACRQLPKLQEPGTRGQGEGISRFHQIPCAFHV